MENVESRLKELGLALPQAAPPAANYIPYVISGSMLFIAGQIPLLNGEKMHFGKLGADMSIEGGQEAARACALNILAQAAAAMNGEWSKIARCVRIGGFVNCTPEFDQMPAVLNAASDLLVAALGEKGRHVRTAVGANSLPFGVAVEIEAIFELTL